jgi:hypothetical protein
MYSPLQGEEGRRANKAPRCYRTTGSAKETPDAWVVDPLRSVVVQVGGCDGARG